MFLVFWVMIVCVLALGIGIAGYGYTDYKARKQEREFQRKYDLREPQEWEKLYKELYPKG
jgi:hypothetical protein